MAKRKGIDNTPTNEEIENMKILAEKIFQPIRDHFGVPIHISSGYRSKKLNKAIGGSSTSQHCKGEAIDIDMDGSDSGITNVQIFRYIKENLFFDQLIWEFGNNSNPSWVHVSYNTSGPQRRHILKATKGTFGTKYVQI
jgi:hypothetical protein